MEPFGTVEPEVSLKPLLQSRHGPVVSDVDVFVLQGSPEPLDIDVVRGPVHPIHADLDPVLHEQARGSQRGIWASLIGIQVCR